MELNDVYDLSGLELFKKIVKEKNDLLYSLYRGVITTDYFETVIQKIEQHRNEENGVNQLYFFIRINMLKFVNYLSSLKDRKINIPKTKIKRPISKLSDSTMFINQASVTLQTLFYNNCSRCKSSPPSFDIMNKTTVNGDRPIFIKGQRLVLASALKNMYISQRGAYYGSYFVPNKTGQEVLWESSQYQKRVTTHLCCIFDAINRLGNLENKLCEDFITSIEVLIPQNYYTNEGETNNLTNATITSDICEREKKPEVVIQLDW